MRKFRPTQACLRACAGPDRGHCVRAVHEYLHLRRQPERRRAISGARFTTNPGLTAPMYVGQNWGITSTPSFSGGGNDFATRRRAREFAVWASVPAGVCPIS